MFSGYPSLTHTPVLSMPFLFLLLYQGREGSILHLCLTFHKDCFLWLRALDLLTSFGKARTASLQ